MNLQTAEKTASLTESASSALSMGNHTESQFEIETLFCPVSWINWKPQTVFVVLGERFCLNFSEGIVRAKYPSKTQKGSF